MTIPIAAADVAATVQNFDAAILVATTPGGWPKVLTVDPHVEGEVVVIPAPQPSALSYVAREPRVTLVWPTRQHHGFSLIVDGMGTVAGQDVRVAIDHAVLHRPPSHADGPSWPPDADDLEGRT